MAGKRTWASPLKWLSWIVALAPNTSLYCCHLQKVAWWVIFVIFFCRLLIVFIKWTFWKNSFANTITVSNSLDPVPARHFVRNDLDPNCGPDNLYQQTTLVEKALIKSAKWTLYSLCPSTCMCLYKLLLCAKAFPQVLQTYGRCPVCILSWVVRCDWQVNALKHILHWNAMGMSS